ncbi:ArsR/SmtB family transcription factor [Stackebrandtia nassauensis]|uniref:Transcriptional regulator, MarR family n=1 Tax=Stackebrandtia nassauensis (strain DSM 44728 / CIP 108903 / NRRL B-16338 / NBRC 102104 / LLR-40K-21) TaxID=446470 RepID=D3Q505_STANL|nr:helix-turn-helix domain-containing protein [Stackebrandtia nassauensis]ADD42185.1 transcriptional regulator, MarR family [Stackebrandtia nassauensis DSM 44728]
MPSEPIPHTSATLKALASPLRRAILRHLATNGPANSTSIGEVFGHNTGTTSYHLRQLAQAGLITEIPERAKGRERWWRTEPGNRVMPDRDTMSAQDKVIAADLERSRLTEDMDALSGVLDNRAELGDWFQGSRSLRFMTKAELKEFHDDYLRLLDRHGHKPEDAPDTARPIALRWYGYPATE